MPIPPTLRLALAVSVAAEMRSAPAALQGLRMIWEMSDSDQEAERAARQIKACLSLSQRHWLGTLRGNHQPTAVSA
jgi:hypothetical protein